MEIIESYKNLFLHPGDFAQDKLVDGWPWWAYALIVMAWNLPGVIFTLVIYSFLAGWMGIPITLIVLLAPFIGVLIVNAPFKKSETTWGEVYQVSLAFVAYSMPVYMALYLLVLGSEFLSFITGVAAVSFLMIILSYLALIVSVIWILISFFKALAGLHMTSPWKIFLWVVAIGTIIGVIFGAFMTTFINHALEGKFEPRETVPTETPSLTVVDQARQQLPNMHQALQTCVQNSEDKETARKCYVALAPEILAQSDNLQQTVHDFAIACNQIDFKEPESDERERCKMQFAIAVRNLDRPDAKQLAFEVCNLVAALPNPDYSIHFSYRFDCYKNAEVNDLVNVDDVVEYCSLKHKDANCFNDASVWYIQQQNLTLAVYMCNNITDQHPLYYNPRIPDDCYIRVGGYARSCESLPSRNEIDRCLREAQQVQLTGD